MQTLLNVGVEPTILDEKELSAMYYAAWEGHLECMRLLSSIPLRKPSRQVLQSIPLVPTASSSMPGPMSIDADGIPELELPPPIIPLRR